METPKRVVVSSQGQLVRVAIYVWMDWNEGMKEGKHPWRKVSYPMGLASDHQRKDWTQVGKAGSQPISPIKQASESTGFVSFSSGIGPEKERAAKLERLAQRSYYFTKAQSNQVRSVYQYRHIPFFLCRDLIMIPSPSFIPVGTIQFIRY